jgi:hypothetical protein
LVLRNVNTGAFQVYNIADNQLTGSAPLGTVGLDWQLPQLPSGLPGGGFAASSPSGSMGSSGSTSQLVQAMAGFGGGAATESLFHHATLPPVRTEIVGMLASLRADGTKLVFAIPTLQII